MQRTCLEEPGNVLPTSFSMSEYTSAMTPCSAPQYISISCHVHACTQ